MKITDIKELKNNIFKLTFTPNKIEKLFGKKEYTKKYKRDIYHEYMFGCGENPIYDEYGNDLGPFHKVTKAIHSYNFRKNNKF